MSSKHNLYRSFSAKQLAFSIKGRKHFSVKENNVAPTKNPAKLKIISQAKVFERAGITGQLELNCAVILKQLADHNYAPAKHIEEIARGNMAKFGHQAAFVVLLRGPLSRRPFPSCI